MDNDKTKYYTNEEIQVKWQPDLCCHSTNCWKAMIKVFDPRRRPWIDLEQGATKNIVAQIEKCPSGALTYEYK